jgi:hypothetical protein
MPFIDAPLGTTKCEVLSLYHGEECVNVFYIDRQAEAISVALANSLMDKWGDRFVDGSFGANVNYSLEAVRITNVDQPDGAQALSTSASRPGITAGEGYPNNVAAVVAWQTGYAGRSRRGRSYLTGIDQDHTDGQNHLTSTAQGEITTGANGFIADLVALGVDLVIASYYSGVVNGVPQPRAMAQITLVTVGAGKSLLATQRRRMPRT